MFDSCNATGGSFTTFSLATDELVQAYATASISYATPQFTIDPFRVTSMEFSPDGATLLVRGSLSQGLTP